MWLCMCNILGYYSLPSGELVYWLPRRGKGCEWLTEHRDEGVEGGNCEGALCASCAGNRAKACVFSPSCRAHIHRQTNNGVHEHQFFEADMLLRQLCLKTRLTREAALPHNKANT